MKTKSYAVILALSISLISEIAQAQVQMTGLTTRATVTANGVLLTEVIVAGSGTRKLLFRGLGPSLSGFISDAIADPTLVLSDSAGNVIYSNNDWKETQQTEIQQTGLAPSNVLESAIVLTLSPGTYTVAERNKNGATGTGVCEVYDLSSGTATLPAVGTRGGVPNTALASGLTLQGGSSQQVLVRALGPSLTVSGSLADPILELYNSQGTLLTSNDDWQTGTSASAVQSSGLAPSDPKESALVSTLAPGSYTALVKGKGGTTGISFLQFYPLPYTGAALPPNPPTPVPGPSQLLNISSRLRVLTGDNALFAGFILTGTDPKKVIVRALGPSLAVGGNPIPGRLADTVLELHDGTGATIATNDNWKVRDSNGSSQEAEIVATTVAPPNDLECAIVATLPANNAGYTAIVRGKGDTVGIGLVDLFDLAQGANSKLANISTRGFVDTGDNVLIGGFIIGGGGGGPAKVIVRGLGPSLSVNGNPVPGRLGDTTLELHDANGALLATNDNWKVRDSDGSSQQAEIEATTVPPTNNLESALVATLPPGNATAVMRGKGTTTGIGVVEVYNIP